VKASTDYPVPCPFDRSRRWNAQWIWTDQDPNIPNAFALFRAVFSVDEAGAEGPCWLHASADTRYRCYVNGVFAGTGSIQSQPYYQYYDTRDIAGFLRPGENCLAFVVYHLGTLEETRGGLLAEVEGRDGETLLATGPAWLACPGEAWTQNTFKFRMQTFAPYQEIFNARRLPEDWNLNGAKESLSWRPATVVAGRRSNRPPAVYPWSQLKPRDLPFMAEGFRFAAEVAKIEECTHLHARTRGNDLSIELSAAGAPLERSRVENPEALLKEEGETLLQTSEAFMTLDDNGIRDPALLLDFGDVITAYAWLEIEAEEDGQIDIGYAERLTDGHFNNAIECSLADRVVLRKGRQTYVPFHWRCFRYLKLRLSRSLGPVRLRQAKAWTTLYPFERKGSFSGDPSLERLFEISRHTIHLCSHEAIMDTPWREGAQWLGDVALVTVGGIYACFGDAVLPSKFFKQSAANLLTVGLISNMSNVSPRPSQGSIPDYSLWWVWALLEHCRYTGDERFLREFYPQATRVMQFHAQYVNERGLLEDVGLSPLVDWANVERTGESASLNAIFAIALEAYEAIARFNGDQWRGDWARGMRGGIEAAFADAFYDAEASVVRDSVQRGERSNHVTEHANMTAIWAGLVDDAKAGRIVDSLFESKTVAAVEAQPFYMSVVLKALRRIGRLDVGLRLARERWVKRMVDRGATSTYEEWSENGSWRNGRFTGIYRTHSHAWSAYPAEFLTKDLIGFEILEPGCRKAAIAPYKAPFAYRASYPTPLGRVEVDWDGTAFRTAVPEGMEVENRAQ